MKKYVFLGNSTKPSIKDFESVETICPSNVSKPCLEAAHQMGYEVYLGTNRKYVSKLKTNMDFPVKLYCANTYRSITNFSDNLTAYKNLKKLLNEGDFEVIHCNTPVGGMIGRLCGKRCKIKKVIYTAHGFHFYKGAPLFNRTILKLAERIMAHWTDAIITMNKEDYEAANKFRLKKDGKVFLVHGVGINLDEYKDIDRFRTEKRNELGFSDTDVVLISMGDLVARKNYKTAIEAVAKANNPNLKYIICGKGEELDNLKSLATSLGIEKQVLFLGFRTDIKELLSAADIFLFTTLQEGLPRSMMEAMAAGLPCVVSKIRGNVDLIEDGEGGYLCESTDADEFAKSINKLILDKALRLKMRNNNLEIIKNYDISVVQQEIKDIYNDLLSK